MGVVDNNSPHPDTNSWHDIGQRSNLTAAQFLMWVGQQVSAHAPLYNMIQTFEINGEIEPTVFTAAWQALVSRADVLRTVIHVERGVPMQSVADEVDATPEQIDLSKMENPDNALEEWLDSRSGKLLDLERCLFDVALIRLGPNRFVWYMCQHHLITDGRSFALTFEYVADFYTRLITGEKLPESIPQYCDHIEREHHERSTERWAKSKKYWCEQIEDTLRIPRFYGAQRARGERSMRTVFQVGKRRSHDLRLLATTEPFAALSENMAINTLWTVLISALIHRICGESEFRIGVPFEARHGASAKNTLGLFIEIGVLNVSISEQESFASLYKKLLAQSFDNLRHVRPGISDADTNRSYGILVNYVTAKFDHFAGLPVSADWIHTGYGDAEHALRIQICDFEGSGEFALHLDCNTDEFRNSRTGWFIEHLNATIDAFIGEPTRTFSSYGLLSHDQTLQRAEFNSTQVAMPDLVSVAQFLEQRARISPTTIAAVDGGASLTYVQLNDAANQLAAHLRSVGVGRNDRVALCFERCLDVLIAIWGTLKSGAIFTPIENAQPERRKQELLQDLMPTCVLTNKAMSAWQKGFRVVSFSEIEWDKPVAEPVTINELQDSAYFIYTSGSTGQPKAAMLTHAGLINYLSWAKATYLGEEALDFALYSSLAFDLTLTSIFLPVLAGSMVRIYGTKSEDARDDLAHGFEILDVFAEDAVDVVKLTPAHLELVRTQGSAFARIRKLILGGEDLKTEIVRRFVDHSGSHLEIYNEYGPTEATIGCMVHRYSSDDDALASVPIGRPAANMQIHLLDAYDQPVPNGVTGEMIVSGPGVALGYWNQTELSTARFDNTDGSPRRYRTGDLARWDEAGALRFLGRIDDQVKLRGVRVELGEIEAAALEHRDIEQCVAVLENRGAGSDRPTAFCALCGLPDSYPNAKFDADGVCSDCRDFTALRPQVDRYFRTPADLERLLTRVRARHDSQPYDCVVLTSGGKDSTYMLYQLVRRFNVQPLVFTLDNGYLSETAIGNVRLACEDLGVDLEVGGTPHMDAIFADSLQRHCNVCDGCFKTIYTLSMELARRLGIRNIVTGLSRGQLFETRLADTFRARIFEPDEIDQLIMEARKAYHQIDDAVYELIATDLFSENKVFDEIEFVDFYRYVDVGLDEVYAYLEAETVWRRPADTGRSTNCLINDAGIYVHKRQKGYHNYALPYSWDVRLGHKTRATALHELDDEIDEGRVKKILAEIGYREPANHSNRIGQRILVYYSAEQTIAQAELREHMAQRLPRQVLPSQFVRLDNLPLTRNGKIDRNALPEPAMDRNELDVEFVEATDPVAKQLEELWSSFVAVSPIGIHDNFFALGGDSVMSIQIASAAQAIGLTITALDIFQYPTIDELSRLLVEMQTAPVGAPDMEFNPDEVFLAAGLEARKLNEVVDVYPLTSVQKGIVFHGLSEPDAGYYIGQVSCALSGAVDFSKVRRAWRDVIDRHEVLRTRVIWEGLDEPVQCVQASFEPEWAYEDYSTSKDPLGEYQILEDEMARRPFDLSVAPPLRFTLARVAADEYRLIWNMHHVLLDGWSAYPLLSEFLEFYDERVGRARQRKPLPFKHFVAWQRGQDRVATDRFWRQYLDGWSGPTRLSLAAPNGSKTTNRVELEFTSQQSSALRMLARDVKISLNCIFQAAWGLLLSRYCDQTDVTHGATFSGRNCNLPGIESMIGLFLNTLPVRLQVRADQPLSSWLKEVQSDLSALGGFEASPLNEIQNLCGTEGDGGLFDSILVFENYPSSIDDGQSTLTVGPLSFRAPSHYPLAVLVYPEEELRCVFLFNERIYDAVAVRRMAAHFRMLLTSMSVDPHASLGTLPMLAPTDLERYRLDAIRPVLTRPRVRDVIEETIKHYPQRTALVCGNRELSYAELGASAHSLAGELARYGVTRGEMVTFDATRDSFSVVAMLAIWQAGAVFVPLDPEFPDTRNAQIARQTNARIHIRAPQDEISPTPIIERQHSQQAWAGQPVHVESIPESGIDAVAYVIYTSGSTGEPKGVAVTHAGLAHANASRVDYYPDRVERFLMLSSFSFDSSMAGLFWTLSEGGTLVLPELGRHQDLPHLLSLLVKHQITHLLSLPSFYRALLQEGTNADFTSLKTSIVAGEACLASVHTLHAECCSDAKLYNEYGPTEVTVWSHVYEFDGTGANPENATIAPIGQPVAHISQLVLDSAMRSVPLGVPGELCLGGPSLAKGYLADPEQTAERFVQLPVDTNTTARFYRTGDLVRRREDGALEFLGRIDNQVKIRGYRVELGEIETVVSAHPQVVEAATVVASREAVDRLVACYVGTEELDGSLRAFTQKKLPSFMVPDEFVQVRAMPRLANGKLDRTALHSVIDENMRGQPALRAPQSDNEQLVAKLWQELLSVENIGLDDDFLALGGDSLSAMRLSAKLFRLGWDADVKTVLQNRTLEQLADALRPLNRALTKTKDAPENFELSGLSEIELKDLLNDLEESD